MTGHRYRKAVRNRGRPLLTSHTQYCSIITNIPPIIKPKFHTVKNCTLVIGLFFIFITQGPSQSPIGEPYFLVNPTPTLETRFPEELRPYMDHQATYQINQWVGTDLVELIVRYQGARITNPAYIDAGTWYHNTLNKVKYDDWGNPEFDYPPDAVASVFLVIRQIGEDLNGRWIKRTPDNVIRELFGPGGEMSRNWRIAEKIWGDLGNDWPVGEDEYEEYSSRLMRP